jgi:tripartite-type tricarboxylate transporter receptor subunit TctC
MKKLLIILSFLFLNVCYAKNNFIMYVPHSGGIADFAARALANIEGNTIVINYPATIGSRAVPLAYERKQLLFAGSSYMVLNDILYPDYNHFDIKNNFESVVLGKVPNVVVIHSSIPAKNIAEFVSYASTAKDLRYGITTAATNVSVIEFMKLTGIKARDIPYKSGDQLSVGLLSNEINFRVGGLTSVIGLLENNKIRAIGITTEKRHKDYPSIPTVREQTGQNLIALLYYGINFPKGMKSSDIKHWKKLIGTLNTNQKYIEETNKIGASIDIIQDSKYNEWYIQQRKMYVDFTK